MFANISKNKTFQFVTFIIIDNTISALAQSLTVLNEQGMSLLQYFQPMRMQENRLCEVSLARRSFRQEKLLWREGYFGKLFLWLEGCFDKMLSVFLSFQSRCLTFSITLCLCIFTDSLSSPVWTVCTSMYAINCS